MFNQDVRMEAKRKGVFMYQIAEKYGINDGNFSRKLRKELPQEEKVKIFQIIRDIVAEREEVS